MTVHGRNVIQSSKRFTIFAYRANQQIDIAIPDRFTESLHELISATY